MRSADTISSRCALRLDRRHQLGHRARGRAGDEPGGAQHPQRIVDERHLGRQRRAQPPGGEVGRAVERVDQRRARAGDERHRVDVKSRRARSVSISSANVDLGLRESSSYDLGAIGGDLVASRPSIGQPDRAEPLALGPHGVGPAGHDRLDLVGPGVGGEVDVAIRAVVGADEQVAHDAADQVQPVSGRVEALGERPTSSSTGAKRSGTTRRGYRRSRSSGIR